MPSPRGSRNFRGRALGLVLAGDGIGLMIFPIIAQSMIDHSGWRNGYFVLGSLTLLIGSAPSILCMVARAEIMMYWSVPRSRGLDLAGGGCFPYSFWIIVGVLFLSSMSVERGRNPSSAFTD